MRLLNLLPAVSFGLLWTPSPGAAHPDLGGAGQEVREVFVTGDRPVEIHVAPNESVTVAFDAKVTGEVVLPGAEVRRHPHLANALSITPAESLASRASVSFKVALVDGEVELVLVLRARPTDRTVRITRLRCIPAPAPAPAKRGLDAKAQESLLRLGARTALGLAPPPAPRTVKQDESPEGLLVREDGGVTYLKVPGRRPGCEAASARLRRGKEEAEVLLFDSTGGGCTEPERCVLLAVRTPEVGAKGYLLELLASDESVCESWADVALGP